MQQLFNYVIWTSCKCSINPLPWCSTVDLLNERRAVEILLSICVCKLFLTAAFSCRVGFGWFPCLVTCHRTSCQTKIIRPCFPWLGMVSNLFICIFHKVGVSYIGCIKCFAFLFPFGWVPPKSSVVAGWGGGGVFVPLPYLYVNNSLTEKDNLFIMGAIGSIK